MAEQPDIIYISECSLCGAKISQSGAMVGATDGLSCKHKFGPVGGYKPAKPDIVWPTDKERHWVRMIDQNKEENTKHHDTFSEDMRILTKNEENAMNEISTMCELLREAVNEREKELKALTTKAFEEREQAIDHNMMQLKEHKKKNKETKSKSEDLLRSDKPVAEREPIIVQLCQNVINTTPNIRYIVPELRCTFSAFENIQRRITSFGELHTTKIGIGQKCVFQSIKDSGKGPSKLEKVELPKLKLTRSTFDEGKGKIKLTFKADIDDKIRNDLYVNVAWIEEADDAEIVYMDQDDDDFDDEKKNDKESQSKPHSETIALKDCKVNGSKYELFVNKKFDGGLTVVCQIRPEFVSPDKEKFESSIGEWSEKKSCGIPPDEDENALEFKVELQGTTKILKLKDDAVALTNIAEFENAILKEFNESVSELETILVLRVDGMILNGKSNLVQYAAESSKIMGKICKLPSKLVNVIEFKEKPRKLVLKKKTKDNVCEFRMDIVKQKLSARFEKDGIADLNGQYKLKMVDSGQVIEIDDVNDDVAKYLVDYNGKMQIVQ